jgi:hypothetical protein
MRELTLIKLRPLRILGVLCVKILLNFRTAQ